MNMNITMQTSENTSDQKRKIAANQERRRTREDKTLNNDKWQISKPSDNT